MLALWIASNPAWRAALRLDVAEMRPALKWGALVGVALGAVNLSLILLIIPALGGDILFLRETPHARAPVWVMFPVGIVVIGILVELNQLEFFRQRTGRLVVDVRAPETGPCDQRCIESVQALAHLRGPQR